MITTCPNCSTAFEVSSTQLAAKAGLVRCGACRQVFNGYRGLAIVPRPAAVASVSAHAQTGDESAPQPALLLPVEPADEAQPQALTAAAAPRVEEPAAAHDETHLPRRAPALDEAAEAVPQQAHDFEHQAPRAQAFAPGDTAASPPRAREPLYQPSLHVAQSSPLWMLGALLLLVALALQAAFLWRADFAQRWPQTRPLFEGVCAALGCTVPAAQALAQLNIESSTLEADTARPGVLVLQTTLQNLAPFVQRYPHLELTLTGVNEDTLAIKVFAPRDYLGAQHDPAHDWAPQQTRAVSLHLEAGTMLPTGFRLRLIYP